MNRIAMLLVVCSLSWARSAQADTAETLTERERWGINPHGGDEGTAAIVDDIGFKWVRIDVPWSSLQPEAPTATTTGFERGALPYIKRTIAAYRARGIKILGVLSSTPAWAARPQDKNTDGSLKMGARPRSSTEYVRYINFAIDQLGADIQYWNLWNEPNLTCFWAGGDTTDFANSVFVPGAAAVHARQPGGKVVGPDFSVNSTKGAIQGWFNFLNAYGASIDIVDLHYYRKGDGGYSNDNDGGNLVYGLFTAWPESDQPWQCRFLGMGCESRRSLVASIDATSKTAGKPVWVTEIGVVSDSPIGGQGDQGQATQYRRMYDLMQQSTYRRVEKMFLYELNDQAPANAATGYGNMGLVRAFAAGTEPRFSPKPAYFALQGKLMNFAAAVQPMAGVQPGSSTTRIDCRWGGVAHQGRCVVAELKNFKLPRRVVMPTGGTSALTWGVDSSSAALMGLGFAFPPSGASCSAVMPTAVSVSGWCHHLLPQVLKVGMPYQVDFTQTTGANVQGQLTYDARIWYAAEWGTATPSVAPDAQPACVGGGVYRTMSQRCELPDVSIPVANTTQAAAVMADLKARGLHLKEFEEQGTLQGLWVGFKTGETTCPYGATPGWGQCRLTNWASQLVPGSSYRISMALGIGTTTRVVVKTYYYPEDALRVVGPRVIRP